MTTRTADDLYYDPWDVDLNKAGIDIPPGLLIFEDPVHDVSRGILAVVSRAWLGQHAGPRLGRTFPSEQSTVARRTS